MKKMMLVIYCLLFFAVQSLFADDDKSRLNQFILEVEAIAQQWVKDDYALDLIVFEDPDPEKTYNTEFGWLLSHESKSLKFLKFEDEQDLLLTYLAKKDDIYAPEEFRSSLLMGKYSPWVLLKGFSEVTSASFKKFDVQLRGEVQRHIEHIASKLSSSSTTTRLDIYNIALSGLYQRAAAVQELKVVKARLSDDYKQDILTLQSTQKKFSFEIAVEFPPGFNSITELVNPKKEMIAQKFFYKFMKEYMLFRPEFSRLIGLSEHSFSTLDRSICQDIQIKFFTDSGDSK